jgi:hypothetical protein
MPYKFVFFFFFFFFGHKMNFIHLQRVTAKNKGQATTPDPAQDKSSRAENPPNPKIYEEVLSS